MTTIAICSGKGGTGKTTVATNLAALAARQGLTAAYLDCDVEEPNGFLFLKPEITETRPVEVSVPALDPEKCVACCRCSRICQYSAVVAVKQQVLIFPELCHGCGGCWLACPTGAITESHRQTGRIDLGHAANLQCVQGLLDVGQAMSPPIIAAVRKAAPNADLVVIDSPPGTSCPVIASIRGSDFVLLVTEPTPFGLHDLKLAVDMVRALELPFAVVINRANLGDDLTRQFCREQAIDVLAEIPDDRRVAQAYSRGQLACDALPEYQALYHDLLDRIITEAQPTP